MSFLGDLLRAVEVDDLIVTFELESRNSLWPAAKFVCTITPDHIAEICGTGPTIEAAFADATAKVRGRLP